MARLKKKSRPCSLRKVYLLVHSHKDLRNRYVIWLGELHIVLAMVREIGTYVDKSEIVQSWVKSGWFSENIMHQVFSCLPMQRVLRANKNISWVVSLQNQMNH